MSKIIDCFLFRDELDMLELRLRYLYDYVDTFVIISGSHTFQGALLPNLLSPLPERFLPFADKLSIHRVPLSTNSGLDSWSLEREQRNGSLAAIEIAGAEPEDLVILSDVDEIWFSSIPSLLRQAISDGTFPKNQKCLIPMWDSYFGADVVQDASWTRVFAMPWSKFKNSDPFKERTIPGVRIFGGNGGWHITYTGGVDGIGRKQETFAHTEFSNTKYVDPEWIDHCVNTLADPYEREINWRSMPTSELHEAMEPRLFDLLRSSYPQFLSKNFSIDP